MVAASAALLLQPITSPLVYLSAATVALVTLRLGAREGFAVLVAAPVFQPVDLAACGFDGGAVTLDHGGNLFALVRMDQEHDFVMTHCLPLVD